MTNDDRNLADDGLALQHSAEKTVQQQVYQALRSALMRGHFRPGRPIGLRSTAAELGTSLTPVREALRRLESEGGLAKGGNRMLTVPMPTVESLHEIRNIRLALEGLATEIAAASITPRELSTVTRHCELMDKAAANNDADLFLEHNWHFHSTIYRAARSPLLLDLIEGLWLRVGPVIRLALPKPGHLLHSMEAHWTAEAALRRRDGPRARAAIERDIADAARDLTTILQAQQRKAANQ